MDSPTPRQTTTLPGVTFTVIVPAPPATGAKAGVTEGTWPLGIEHAGLLSDRPLRRPNRTRPLRG